MTKSRENGPLRFLLGLFALAGISSTPTSIATEQSQVIEEVVVSAERREESLQDVSLSVTVFSEEALQLGGIDDVSPHRQHQFFRLWHQSSTDDLYFVRNWSAVFHDLPHT